jgi:hypothetical protein
VECCVEVELEVEVEGLVEEGFDFGEDDDMSASVGVVVKDDDLVVKEDDLVVEDVDVVVVELADFGTGMSMRTRLGSR